ncbi:MAG: hypothetical protein JXA79_11405 [Deltaproteobacteria bacterium]|nr:hypothetical protein [Deltaproteobacteria bacterium]
MDQFFGYHSEWNLGSPGGWDYQRITQEIGQTIWRNYFQKNCNTIDLDFEHPFLKPVNGFVSMLQEAHRLREGHNPGLIAVVVEEETLEDVAENKNLVRHLNAIEGLSGALMAPHELERQQGRVCWQGRPVSVIFMDFNTDVLLALHQKNNLTPLLQAVQEGRVINPRGTEPINAKSMFEVITEPLHRHRFQRETIQRTPWTRQFYPRQTQGPKGEHISDLIEWTRSNWENLVLKPERGYSGKGVRVGGIHHDIDNIINLALKSGDYIVQQKVPLKLWAEKMPELDVETNSLHEVQNQTDFRSMFGPEGLYGFLGRFGGVPTNVGSGGGMQPLAVLRSEMSVGEATQEMNKAIVTTDFNEVQEAIEHQKKMSMDHQFTYLLGPIKLALRPRLITLGQIKAIEAYCAGIWADCLTLEKMWLSGQLDDIVTLEPEELEIIRSQPWDGTAAIFASDGLFSFGAHLK